MKIGKAEIEKAARAMPETVTISGELYAFLMGQGPLEGVWFDELNEGLPGRYWWRGLLACSAGWPEVPTPTAAELAAR